MKPNPSISEPVVLLARMGQDSVHSDTERRVMRSCIMEAFWARSAPLAVVTMLGVGFAARRRGVLHGGALALGSGSGAYLLGKLSYILGENCIDKFIKDAPGSPVAVHALQKREKSRRFEELWRSGEVSRTIREVDVDSLEKHSEEQRWILVEACNRSIAEAALPCSLASSSLVLLLLRLGLVKGSQRLPSLPWLPKVFLAAGAGFFGGIVIYARSIPRSPEREVEEELLWDDQETLEEDDYMLPGNESQERYQMIKET